MPASRYSAGALRMMRGSTSTRVLARRLGVPLVAIPTIAATCAAWTPLSVWYSDAGPFG
jgi:alcohol dehydrogenase class IV